MAAPLDLELLKTFVAVVEAGNLSSAAPRVGRSQSAVSMQLQRLEQSLGRTLLTRSPRAVTLTEAGEGFLVYARRLLKLSDEAVASIRRPEEAGTVRLGVPDDYAAFLLPSALARFSAAHPLVMVELICEQSSVLTKIIDSQRIDVAIVTRSPDQPLEVLRREHYVWVASPDHVAWEIDPLPVALFEPNSTGRVIVVEALEETGRPYRSTYFSASVLGLVAVVQAGLAVAALPEHSVPPSLRIVGENEGLPPLRDLEIGIMRGSTPETAAVERLHEFLRRDLIAGSPPRGGPFLLGQMPPNQS